MRKNKMLECIDSLNSQNIALRARIAVLEQENKKLNIRLNDAFNAMECLAKEVHNHDCNE